MDAVNHEMAVTAAAYTAVYRAEDEPELAFAVNALAPGVLAAASARAGAWMVHFSSDYVYDGQGARPWREVDPPAPSNVYGRSKLPGTSP